MFVCIYFTDFPIQNEKYGMYLQRARLYSKLLIDCFVHL